MALAGCLPSSCQREAPRALMPADSLSRQVAEATPADTLRRLWQATGIEGHVLAYPRTVRFGPGGRVYVSDVERNSIFAFSEEGAFVREVRHAALAAPYLIGWRGDTLLAFSPFEMRVDFFVEGAHVDSLHVPVELPEDAPLAWAAADSQFVYVKVLSGDTEGGGRLVQVDRRGRRVAARALPGPSWRRAGMLRLWGDTLVSLSGFRPVADLFPRDLRQAPEQIDTLALVGFNSPMLARSRAYLTGEADRPPLLTESAAASGDRLFVLNLRPGWLQVDVFDRAGRLERRLVQKGGPQLNRNFYPRDLAVRRRADGSYLLAAAFTDPQPMVELYRWTPPVEDAGPRL